jgi:phosphonate transport system permease protein
MEAAKSLDQVLTDTPAMRARYPEVFRTGGTRYITAAIVVFLVALLIFGLWRLGFSASRFIAGIGQLGHFIVLMIPPDPGGWSGFMNLLRSLGETLAIAFGGTLLAACLAVPFGILAAKNVVPTWIFHFSLRRGLDIFRGVDVLIWALIWVNVVGLGPFTGLLAIATSDFGTFGKLFSEAIEGANKGPGEGVVSTGGSKVHVVRFAILPQVFPVIASQILYYIESNTRSATIIGIVGAGGIGLYLAEAIRTLEWQLVSFIVIMILITVGIIDTISNRIRFAIIGRREGAV